tara:strand:- start:62 stop:775 length:714 start_codon:yes stop_codon:yes gene_type:complete
MNKVYIFDIDGTLTPSRLRMTEKFAKFFDEWSSKNKYYLVTGSDLPKTEEQLPIAYTDRAEAIFTCCGNQMWKDNKLVYDNKFELSTKLKNSLEVMLMSSQYKHRYGNHIEDRGSMVNFSIVGRNCTQEQREEYYEWDKEKSERKKLSTFLKHKFKDLDAVIGGQISIDIYPKGNDKSQILKHIWDKDNEYIFIGDGIDNKGNDFPLAESMNLKDNCSSYHTEGWEQTKQILEKLSD